MGRLIIGDGNGGLILACSVLFHCLLIGRHGEERLVVVQAVGMAWILPGVNVGSNGPVVKPILSPLTSPDSAARRGT